MNVAGAIATTLVDEGVDTVFSLLGEATMHVVSALDALGVKVVDCRHEGAAMAMADGQPGHRQADAVRGHHRSGVRPHARAAHLGGRTRSQVIVLTACAISTTSTTVSG